MLCGACVHTTARAHSAAPCARPQDFPPPDPRYAPMTQPLVKTSATAQVLATTYV